MLSEKRVKLLDVDTPSQICIKASSINPCKHGIWCREVIKSGTKFGPYAGEKAYEVDEGMDPAYIWEIVDVETKEFLFYINASNPRHSNWMRYVNCARFLEEQNIVAQQEGIDIYYHAIKDIQPGEELLTWYEKTPVKKKKGKKKIEAIAVKRAQTGPEIKPIMRSSEVSTRGRRRVVRKIWKEMNDTVNDEEENEEANEGEDEEKSENEEDNEEEWNAPKITQVPSLQGPVVFNESHASSVQSTQAAIKPNIIRNEGNSENTTASSQQNISIFASGDKISSCIYTTNITTSVNSDVQQKTPVDPLPMLVSLKLPKYSANTTTNDIPSDSNKVNNPNEVHDSQTNVKTQYTTSKSNMPSNVISTKTLTNKGGNFFSFEQMVESTPPSVLSFWKSGRKMFRCDICMGEYKHSFSLKRHYIRSHITFKYINRLDVVSCGVIPPKDSENNSVVDTAGSKENDEAKKNVIKNPQEINNSGVSDVSNERASMPGLYRCNICDRFFDLKSDLQKHWGEHENNDNTEKNFNCPSCSMTFRHKQNLLKHEITHTGAKPFSCQKCHKTFPTATNQKRHERIHVGHRLTCYICSATFTQAGDLKKHTCKQHPESYNECAYCTKYFVTELSLSSHLKEAHGKDIEANRKRVCVKKKARKMLLERDRAESRRLALEEMQNKNRRNAQNVPAPGEETYACTACRKVFQNYSNMCRHRRLAHYRDGTEQPWNKLEEMFDESYFDDENNLKEDEVPNGVTGKLADKFESLQNYFFQVSGNIALNLENYLEGTQDQINNASNHIRWKQRTNGRLNGGRVNGTRPMISPLCDLDLEELNFPTGFIIPEKLEYLPAACKEDDREDEKIIEEHHVENDKQQCPKNDEKIVTTDKTSDTSQLDDINTIHDYSKKPQQKSLQSVDRFNKVDEGVLDLSKHIKCVYNDSTPPNFPCLVPPNDDDDDENQSYTACLAKHTPTVDTNNQQTSHDNVSDALDKVNNADKKFICLVCYQEFNSKLSVTDHQERQHSHVDSRHLEVDKDFVVTWIKTPNPIGQLNVTSSMLPLTEIEVEEAARQMEAPSSSTSLTSAVPSPTITPSVMDAPLTTSSSVTASSLPQETSESIQNTPETSEVNKEIETADKVANESLETSALIVVAPDNITQTSNSAIANDSPARNLPIQETSQGITSANITPKKATKTCTKCRQPFSSRVELHKHISDECGDYWRNLKDRVSWVFVLRGTEIPAAPTQGSPDKKRVKYRGNGLMRTDGLVSEDVYKKQLQKILVQQHVGDDGGDGVMLSKSSGCSKVMTRRRSQEVGGAVVRAFDDPDYMVRARRRELIMNNAANRKTKGEPDSTPETGPSEAVTAEEEEEEDDGFEYDPMKHMCIYCRHQFLYIRTLRKHVVEFCHVRKEFKEKGELLDSEWEDGLQSMVTPSNNNAEANNDGEDGRKGNGGSMRKKRKRNWTSNKNNKNNKTPSKTKPIYSNQSSNTSSSHSPDISAPPPIEFCLNVSNSIKQLVKSGVDSDKTTTEAKTFSSLATPIIKTAPITVISGSEPITKHPNIISNTFITTVTTIPTISSIPTIPTIITKKITTTTGDKIVSTNSIRPIILVRSDNKTNMKVDTVVNDMKPPFDVIPQQNITPQTTNEVAEFEDKKIKEENPKEISKGNDDKDEEKEDEKEESGSEIRKTRKRRGPRLTMVKRKKPTL